VESLDRCSLWTCWRLLRWRHLVLADWLGVHISLRFLQATSIKCRSYSAEVLAHHVVTETAWISLHHKEEISVSGRLVSNNRRVFVPLSHLHHLLFCFQAPGNQSLTIICTF
jgi:hypothetical protein